MSLEKFLNALLSLGDEGTVIFFPFGVIKAPCFFLLINCHPILHILLTNLLISLSLLYFFINILRACKTPSLPTYLPPFEGALPRPPPDLQPVVLGQFPPGPGCEEGPRPLPELLFELFDTVTNDIVKYLIFSVRHWTIYTLTNNSNSFGNPSGGKISFFTK